MSSINPTGRGDVADASQNLIQQPSSRASFDTENSLSSCNEENDHKNDSAASSNCVVSFFGKIWELITSVFHCIFSCGCAAKKDASHQEKESSESNPKDPSADLDESRDEIEELFAKMSARESLLSPISLF